MTSSKQDESSFCVWVIISCVLCIVLVNTYSSNQEETKSLIAAVDMQISQTATTLAVAFELFSTKQEKLLR